MISCAEDFSLSTEYYCSAVLLFLLISLTTMTAEADFRACPRFRPFALWLGLALARPGPKIIVNGVHFGGGAGRGVLAYLKKYFVVCITT